MDIVRLGDHIILPGRYELPAAQFDCNILTIARCLDTQLQELYQTCEARKAKRGDKRQLRTMLDLELAALRIREQSQMELTRAMERRLAESVGIDIKRPGVMAVIHAYGVPQLEGIGEDPPTFEQPTLQRATAPDVDAETTHLRGMDVDARSRYGVEQMFGLLSESPAPDSFGFSPVPEMQLFDYAPQQLKGSSSDALLDLQTGEPRGSGRKRGAIDGSLVERKSSLGKRPSKKRRISATLSEAILKTEEPDCSRNEKAERENAPRHSDRGERKRCNRFWRSRRS